MSLLASHLDRLKAEFRRSSQGDPALEGLLLDLEKLLDRPTRILTQIARVGRALNSIRDADKLLSEILSAAQEALGLNRVALLLPDRCRQVVVVRSAVGYGPILGKRIPYGQGVTGKVAETGRAEWVRDVRSDPRYLLGVEGGVTEMAVPLHVYGEFIGVLDTESPEPEAFDEGDLELFQLFADQAAVAIHNAQLFRHLEEANRRLQASVEEMTLLNRDLEAHAQRIQRANQELEHYIQQLHTLFEASQTISSSLDLKQTLDAILQMTGRIVNSSSGAIKLLDAETQELKVKAQAGFTHEESALWDRLHLPLRIGDKTIGVFELIRDATSEMGESERKMLESLASHAAVAIENARLFENTQRVYYETLKSLAKALEARDDYTRGHSERVAELSLTLAQQLGLEEEEGQTLYNAALLHDIGKIGVRDSVLLKIQPLSGEEMRVIQSHPEHGTTILSPLKFLGFVGDYVKHHHERWDGTGYPEGLQGACIPLASRIIAVADAYDAMTSSRPYRKARTHDEAMAEIQAQSGKQFDPRVVEAFVQIMAIGQGDGDERI